MNNSLALASQVVTEPKNRPGRSQWVPSVSIQGKLYHMVGPLEPDVHEDGRVDTRQWAQLYVHDPAVGNDDDETELQARFAGLKFSDRTSHVEKERVLSLLRVLQDVMHDENTYVHDFIMAGELFATEGVEGAELVISRDTRPVEAHARQYDPPSGAASRNFQEVTVLVGEGNLKRGGVQLRQRGGGAWRIDYNNRAFDPLHFVLMFPHGDDGWHWYMERAMATGGDAPNAAATGTSGPLPTADTATPADAVHNSGGSDDDGGGSDDVPPLVHHSSSSDEEDEDSDTADTVGTAGTADTADAAPARPSGLPESSELLGCDDNSECESEWSAASECEGATRDGGPCGVAEQYCDVCWHKWSETHPGAAAACAFELPLSVTPRPSRQGPSRQWLRGCGGAPEHEPAASVPADGRRTAPT